MPNLRRPSEFQDDRPSRGKIAYRRFIRLLRPIILLLVVFGLFGGGSIILIRLALKQQYFPIREKIIQLMPLKIEKIEITGCTLTSKEEVMEALGVQKGDSILQFSVNDAKKNLNVLPFVDHVLIERQLPGSIIIHISERTPFAVWQNQGKFVLIDRQGNIVNDHGMSGKDGNAFLKLPLVVGKGANLAAAELLDIITTQPEIKKRLVAAVRVGERRWNLDLRDGTTVFLPENQEEPAVQRLIRYQKDFQLLDRPVKNIDLRLPDRMVIRQNKTVAPNNNNPDTETGSQPNADSDTTSE